MTADRTLTPKQRCFVEAYLSNGRNAAKAYRAAYDTSASPQRVAEEAAKLLRHPKITPIIEKASQKARERIDAVVERYAINKGRIADELARLGFANMLDYIRIDADGDAYVDLSNVDRDQAIAIAEVVVEDFKDGRGEDARDVRRVRFKLADKRAALMDLAKLAGYIVDRKVRVIRSIRDLSDDELDAILGETEADETHGCTH